jgi:hypothetical protein
MKSLHPRNLVLVVPSQGSSSRPWVLEPEGRNTFKIVVVCRPKNQAGATSSRNVAAS